MRRAKPPSALRPPWVKGLVILVATAFLALESGAVRAAEVIRFPESAALPPATITPETRPGPRASLPQPLPQIDAWRYRRIFQLQDAG